MSWLNANLEDGQVRAWELYTGGKPGVRYTWNGSLTVNVWRQDDTLVWVNFTCFTFSEQPADDKEVEETVLRHHHEAMEDGADPRYTEHRGKATRKYLMGGYDPALEPLHVRVRGRRVTP